MYDDVSSEDKYLYGVEFTKFKYCCLAANITSDFYISFCWLHVGVKLRSRGRVLFAIFNYIFIKKTV